MAAPTRAPVTRPPLIKLKWFLPFLPWFSIGVATLKDPAYWLSLEGRILHVIGCAAYSVALLAVIQPWHRDDDRRTDQGLRREPDRIDDRGWR